MSRLRGGREGAFHPSDLTKPACNCGFDQVGDTYKEVWQSRMPTFDFGIHHKAGLSGFETPSSFHSEFPASSGGGLSRQIFSGGSTKASKINDDVVRWHVHELADQTEGGMRGWS
jgi:hypothetical protein